MKLPVASALVIGVIGAIITYLYVGPLGGLGLMVPATFLGAASYFAAGGDKAALAKSVPTTVWGIVPAPCSAARSRRHAIAAISR
jgi:hypothetical protein